MLSTGGRKPAAVVVEPLARGALAIGLTPNSVTVIGTVCAMAASILLIPSGHLVAAAVVTIAFAALDMLDGTMARMRGGGTSFGATLDACCDRMTDAALFGAITWWLIYSADAPQWLVAATLVVLASSQIISYVKARAEASGFEISGGLVERPERLIVGLGALAITGFGVPWAMEVGMGLLAVGSVFTVIQRLVMASRQTEVANSHIAAPKGAKEFPDQN